MTLRTTVGNYIGCTAYDIYLESGTPTDGVWKASCYQELSAPNGEYWLEIHVNDVQKNQVGLFEYHAFTLYGGAKPDLVAPTIKDIHYSSSTIHRGDTFEITAHMLDAQTGVNHAQFSAVEPYSQYTFCRGNMNFVSGTAADGIWSYICTVPTDCDVGYYSTQFYAYDNQNNAGYVTSSINVVV